MRDVVVPCLAFRLSCIVYCDTLELSLGVAHKMRIRKSFVNGKWGIFADNQFIY